MLHPRSYRSILTFFGIVVGLPLMAQLNFGKGVQLSGNVSLSYQFYATDTFNGGFASIRQPKHLPRFIGNFTLDIQGKLRLPVQIRLAPVVQVSGFGVNTNAEGPGSLNILRYLIHPANHLYVNPTYKGVSMHLGHFILPYSPLTVGDIKVMGIGADYRHGSLSYSVQHGVIQPRVANVDFNSNNGSYSRSLTAIRVGHLSNNKWKNSLSFAITGDDSTSLETVPLGKVPQQSTVLSYHTSYKLDAKSRVQLELASSSWAPNLRMADTLREFGVTNFLTPNTTLFGGTGVAISGNTVYNQFKLRGKLDYRSKNYRTLAYPFMQADMLDLQLATNYISPDRKIQARASLGYLGSNVSEARGSRLNIPVLKLNGGYRYNEQWMANVLYSVNTVRSTPNDQGMSVKSANQVIRLLPSYSFSYVQVRSVVALVVGLTSNTNSSDFLPSENRVSTSNVGMSYRATYLKHSANLSFNSFSTKSNGVLAIRYNTITISGMTKLMEDALLPFARITFTSASNADMKLGSKRMTQLGVRYSVNDQLTGSLSTNIHYSKQGVEDNSPGYREYIIAFGLNYRL